jgi:hypothetical protein
MVDQPPEPVDAPRRLSDEAERARAVAEVLRDQEERAEVARAAEARREVRTRSRRGALVVAWVAIAYVWLASPSWLRVEPPRPQSVTDEARSLRLNIFFQSQKIEAYREARGRLPYVLEEAGPPFGGIEYRRKDGRYYELRGESERVHQRYESERPAIDFLGRASERLEEALGTAREGSR